MKLKQLFFLLLVLLHHGLVAQTKVVPFESNQPANTPVTNLETERAIKLKKLHETVLRDTTSKKTGSFVSNFKQKYQDDSDFNYDTRMGDKSIISKLKEKLGYLLEKLFGISKYAPSSELVDLMLRLLATVVVLIALYFFVRIYLRRKGNFNFKKNNEPIILDINNVEQLIQLADFENIILGFEKKGDVRQSIRLYYLWLLKVMKDNNHIDWLPEKTNADYLLEITDLKLRNQFNYLSYLFNYVWYGEFSINDNDYQQAKNAFLTFIRKEQLHG